MTDDILKFDGDPLLIGEPDIAVAAHEASEGDAAEEVASSPTPPICEYICGSAGTGKTYRIKAAIAEDSSWGMLCATTGIAAVNLDAITLNSALKYFDTDSLRDAYLNGRLARALHDIALDHRRLVIDEVSMMDAQQLQLIRRALEDANAYRDLPAPMGLTLVGDFAQLPPVRAQWAFEADCWGEFAANTTRLDKVWRQDEAAFLAALNAARAGDGNLAADTLTRAGVDWATSLDTEYEGTTIIPKNDAVDRYNWMKLDAMAGTRITVPSRRWGKARGEWKNVPDRLELKLGAYVMLLANHPEFEYVNGDCGIVTAYSADTEEFTIELARNGHSVTVGKLVRSVDTKDKPDGWRDDATRVGKMDDANAYITKPHYRVVKRRYVLGQVEYMPLRLAYASTVHKSQGLSLDKVQIDFRDSFFGQPAMLYTALSRCRTLAGLRLVGQRERFIGRCNMDSRVKGYL
jgi:ATP-dependent DNA helicase PIF1